ncbi:MAG TPA: stalk domain-containing protein [Caldisericia bacterium]|nr:stalk domain-containing protein [Caldisericia bacterium]HPF48561.1 stalk domain-containing protein [Caldisericia bacterium]HPI83779.1 stalk domain-containing protein [Caldisericia bacterium]HPQ93016.1 stalk domain-containing protein [Caldisericia bacterium]HRV75151.1 stalk domain-containing protein [Caldisericia bacterium]
MIKKIYKFVNICLLLLIIACLSGFTNSDETTIKIATPPSGLHTRETSLFLRGSVSNTNINSVDLLLDGATIGRISTSCKDGTFSNTVTLGAGKTAITAQAFSDGQYIEAGIVVYRDCSVTAGIGESQVYVNSGIDYLANPILIIYGRSLVPLREFANFFGAEVGWDDVNREITVTLGRLKSSIKLGSDQGTIDGVKTKCDPPAKSINSTAYVPSRFLASMVGGGVSWNGSTKMLTVAVP